MVLADPEDVEDYRDSHADLVETMSWEIDSESPWSVVNKELYYYDAADIASWAPILSKLFVAIHCGISEGAIHA